LLGISGFIAEAHVNESIQLLGIFFFTCLQCLDGSVEKWCINRLTMILPCNCRCCVSNSIKDMSPLFIVTGNSLLGLVWWVETLEECLSFLCDISTTPKDAEAEYRVDLK
jgi:hypothetical protein